jgi:transposase
MTKKVCRRMDAGLKAKVALKAVREQSTAADLAKKYQVHVTHVYAWKKQLLDNALDVFGAGAGREAEADRAKEPEQLHAKIGRLTVEIDFLGKASGR